MELSVRAKRFLTKLPSYVSIRIRKKLRILEQNPVPLDARFVGRHKGEKVFRIRIGHFRVLYMIKDNIILVAKIDKRERVYD